MTRRVWVLLLIASALTRASELRLSLHSEPKTRDPLLAADESSEAIKYLTEGVLIRINRLTQQPEPELAVSWSATGHKVTFELRRGVVFPDGTPFTSQDVVETFRVMLDPALHSPIADTFKTDKGAVKVTAAGDYTVVAEFPGTPGGFERLFDQVPIISAHVAQRPAPGIGPFLVASRTPGTEIVLQRNPKYWKHENGAALPRVDTIRFVIQENRDLELLHLQRGEIDLIDKLTPDLYDHLNADAPGTAVDSGPTMDVEFLWFNLARQAPIPEFKKAWFASTAFRHAISEAIHRDDLVRVVYRGHATSAAGFVSPSNKHWFKAGLKPDSFDPAAAIKRLNEAGFHLHGDTLRDSAGNAVEFSVITNAGSKTREQMAAMIQQDLSKIGVKLNIVTLEFPSLIERMTHSLSYETCLLGLVNVEADPNGWMNVLLSSGANHPWSPAEKSPEMNWEVEIDRLMLAQAAAADFGFRKKDYDRVQDILREQSPVVFLLHPNALSAVSKRVSGIKPAAFFPRTFWDAEHLTVTK